MKLNLTDRQHVSAVQGWLELGLPAEAFAELDRIAPELRAHPDVLEVRLSVYFAAENWAEVAEVARRLTALAPDRFSGWWQLSFALHEMGRTQEAFDNLTSVRNRFSGEWLTHYNLACYLVLLGRVEEARVLFKQGFEINPEQRIDAMDDLDLPAQQARLIR